MTEIWLVCNIVITASLLVSLVSQSTDVSPKISVRLVIEVVILLLVRLANYVTLVVKGV